MTEFDTRGRQHHPNFLSLTAIEPGTTQGPLALAATGHDSTRPSERTRHDYPTCPPRPREFAAHARCWPHVGICRNPGNLHRQTGTPSGVGRVQRSAHSKSHSSTNVLYRRESSLWNALACSIGTEVSWTTPISTDQDSLKGLALTFPPDQHDHSDDRAARQNGAALRNRNAFDDEAFRLPHSARVVFYGRVARGDDTDAQLAVLRQLQRVTAALPAGASIVGRFADVGPWNGLRGSVIPTNLWTLDGNPVIGGLRTLLDRVQRGDHDFDAVACVGPAVLSRRFHDMRQIADALDGHGVRVMYADEPPVAQSDSAISRPITVDYFAAAQTRLRPRNGGGTRRVKLGDPE